VASVMEMVFFQAQAFDLSFWTFGAYMRTFHAL